MVDSDTPQSASIAALCSPGYAGAVGAALWGAYRHERLQELQQLAAA